MRHHLDPVSAQTDLLATLDPLLATLTALTDADIDDLLAFLAALTDPTAANLSHSAPELVPGGLGVDR